MKKTLLAVAVGAALVGASGSALAGSIGIDRNGTEAGGLILGVSEIVWATGNVLFDGIAPGGGIFTLRGHHTLSSFQNGGSNSPATGTEWTVVYELPMIATLVGGVTNLLNAGPGTMVWYYDNTGVGGAGTTGGVQANAVTGLGYGDGLPIMLAAVNIALPASLGGTDGASGTITVTPVAPPSGSNLDQGPNGTNDTPGITTFLVSGSVSLAMNVITNDPNFFPLGLQTTFTTDLTYGSTTSTPFLSTEPSDIVAFSGGGVNPSGVTAGVAGPLIAPPLLGGIPNYGDQPGTGNAGPGNNDLVCANATHLTCDVHTSGTGNTSFLGTFVPEPGSVALLGLGLGLLGFGTRKRKA